MVPPAPIYELPLETLRNIISFCPGEQVCLLLPQVSRRFYHACNDRELLRGVFERELSFHLDSVTDEPPKYQSRISLYQFSEAKPSVHLTIERLVQASRSRSEDGPSVWSRWIIALRAMRHLHGTWDVTNHPRCLKLMQYVPHLYLNGIPFQCAAPRGGRWMLHLFAFYFLDASGPPAFRSRLYSEYQDWQEMNLRMAICLTAFVLQWRRRDHLDLFARFEALQDQSVASWLHGALIGSRDYLLMKNSTRAPARRHTTPQVEALITVMCMAASFMHYAQQTIIKPDLARIPLLAQPDMSKYPVPFDVRMDNSGTGSVRISGSFTEMVTAQQTHFLETDAISQGTWCGYHLSQPPRELDSCLYGPTLRHVKFHTTKIAAEKWEIQSDFFECRGQYRFVGTMEGDGRFCSIYLVRESRDPDEHFLEQEHWHGQLSPFGISGGYSIQTPDHDVFTGGLFWLWKEDWVTSESSMPTY